jgi:hypothetical protein
MTKPNRRTARQPVTLEKYELTGDWNHRKAGTTLLASEVDSVRLATLLRDGLLKEPSNG